MIKPHELFEVWRADEVAECLEGVPEWLYTALWHKVVVAQKALPNREDSGPHDHIGTECLAKYWDRLTDAEQVKLNELAQSMEDRQ